MKAWHKEGWPGSLTWQNNLAFGKRAQSCRVWGKLPFVFLLRLDEIMRWSFKIARIWGIDVRIHVTFFLLLSWIFFSRIGRNGVMWAGVMALAITMVVFTVVVLHEYGHALTAREFDVPTRDRTLWPFGGVAALEGMIKTPGQEILVSLAGPAVNFILAGLTWLFGEYIYGEYLADLLTYTVQIRAVQFLELFMVINLVLGGFNLIPAFPMDGGRVLRGLLSKKYGLLSATDKAVKVGYLLAFAMGVYGLAYKEHMFLIVVAVFVWWVGRRELEQVVLMERMRRLREGRGSLEDLFSVGLGSFGNFVSHVLNVSGLADPQAMNFGYNGSEEANVAEDLVAPKHEASGGKFAEALSGNGEVVEAEFIGDEEE